jgi:sodium/proline symporter
MAIRKTSELKQGAAIAISWAIPAFTGAFIIGLVGYGVFSGNTDAMVVLSNDAEKIMPMLARTLLPAWLAGIFISGAIAAMMSTADSQLLVTTSAISEDIYHKLIRNDASQDRLVAISRIATITIGIIAFFMAISSRDLVFTMVGFAWAGLGSSFGPPILLTLWWKRITKEGVLAGMITGAVTTVVWSGTDLLASTISERFSSFILALVVSIVVSLLTRLDEKALERVR